MALVESIITEKGIIERDKVKCSIDLLREFEPMALELDPEGYYLTYSGGKDSDTNLEICIAAGIKFTVNYNITGIDPREAVIHIKQTRERLKAKGIKLYMHPPKIFTTGIFKGLYKNMWRLIIHKMMPPTRKIRYCCSDLKEHGGTGKLCITGVRWAESTARKNGRGLLEVQAKKKADRKFFNDNDKDRRQFENCMQKGKRVINPIINWEDEDVWDYLKGNKCLYCDLYNQGWDRIGCIGCPNGGTAGQEEDFRNYPHYKKMYIWAFQLMLEHMWSKGIKTTWKTGEDVFEWWLYSTDKEQEEFENQISMFNVG